MLQFRKVTPFTYITGKISTSHFDEGIYHCNTTKYISVYCDTDGVLGCLCRNLVRGPTSKIVHS